MFKKKSNNIQLNSTSCIGAKIKKKKNFISLNGHRPVQAVKNTIVAVNITYTLQQEQYQSNVYSTTRIEPYIYNKYIQDI